MNTCDRLFGFLFDDEQDDLYEQADDTKALRKRLLSLFGDRRTQDDVRDIELMASLKEKKLATIFVSFYRRIHYVELAFFESDYPEDDREAIRVFTTKFRNGTFGSRKYIEEYSAHSERIRELVASM